MQRADQRRRGARQQLAVLVEEQAELAPRLRQQAGVVGRLARAALERDHAQRLRKQPVVRGDHAGLLDRAVVGGVVEQQDLAAHAIGVGRGDRSQAGAKVLAPVRVDDAVGELN